MKIVERILVGIGVFGIVLKLLHWPGGNIALVLSLMLLSLFYFAASYFLYNPTQMVVVDGYSYKQTSTKKALLAVITGMSMPVALIGLLFRLMHWPGAAVMLLVGLVTIAPIAILNLVLFLNRKDEFYQPLAIRTLIVAILSAIGLAFYW